MDFMISESLAIPHRPAPTEVGTPRMDSWAAHLGGSRAVRDPYVCHYRSLSQGSLSEGSLRCHYTDFMIFKNNDFQWKS